MGRSDYNIQMRPAALNYGWILLLNTGTDQLESLSYVIVTKVRFLQTRDGKGSVKYVEKHFWKC